MEGEASTSHESSNSEMPNSKKWTRDLHVLRAFTYDLLTKYLDATNFGAGALKHKKTGYQLFKDKYITNVVVKANVMKGSLSCFFW
jgi:hypothetical protein